LDGIIWQQVVGMLEDPTLIRREIRRRLREIQDSNPAQKRRETLDKEITRQQKCIEKLLDAYQEGLLEIDELRNRMPMLRKRLCKQSSEAWRLAMPTSGLILDWLKTLKVF